MRLSSTIEEPPDIKCGRTVNAVNSATPNSFEWPEFAQAPH